MDFLTTTKIVLILMMLPGVAFAIWGIFILRKAKGSQNWPSVPGKIQSATISEEEDDDNETVYYPKVVYSYSVDGNAYTSSNIVFAGVVSTRSFEKAQDYISGYSEGKSITVFYNPQKNDDAVLQRKTPVVSWILIVAGVTDIIVCVLSMQ